MKPSWADALHTLWGAAIATVLASFAAGLFGCASPRREPGPLVERTASRAFLDAWQASRRPGFASDDEARALALARAELASELDPGWIAPARFVDEWRHRPDLTLPGRYAAHLESALQGDAASLYMAGRLGGESGDRLLARSVEVDPGLGWGWHGLAWQAFLAGDRSVALRSGRNALEVARDPSEAALFSWALARYHRSDDDTERAQAVLRAALDREDSLRLRAAERQYVEAELATVELESTDSGDVRRGVRRALAVLERPGLTESERLTLAARLSTIEGELVSREEVELANATAAQRATHPAERASILESLDAFGGSVREDDAEPLAFWRDRLPAAFGDALDPGAVAHVLEEWCRALPAVTKDAEGLPLRPEVRRIIEAVRGVQVDPDSADRAREVGEALIAAGWFREARSWAQARLEVDAETSREVEIRALRGRATLASVLGLARRVDAREAFVGDGAVGTVSDDDAKELRLASTRAIHDEIVGLLRRTGVLHEGGDSVESPRIEYGPIGSVVHPGPTFSAEDERLGRGIQGERVPGLASLFGALGRFALIGQGAGQGGPDATVLRIVYVEDRAGRHFGREYRGTVFWCEGADVPGRFGRLGAAISGAALHEGFYIDLEIVGRDLERWGALLERFDGRPEALAAALDVKLAAHDAVVRTGTRPALGAADRMRLTVMADGLAGGLRAPDAGDLAHVVATHEEGHLCDRAEWYPVTFGRIMKLIGLATAHGFSGVRISEALEERAQLVALCAADDPRLAWVDLLDAIEGGASGSVTPHAAAYTRLLGDLIERLEEEFEAGEWQGRGVDPGCRWVDQIHLLDAEDLRGLAVREARARGLARD